MHLSGVVVPQVFRMKRHRDMNMLLSLQVGGSCHQTNTTLWRHQDELEVVNTGIGGGDDKLKISSRKVSIWGSILQTILSNFPIYLLFRSFKKNLPWPNYFCMFSAARPVALTATLDRAALNMKK